MSALDLKTGFASCPSGEKIAYAWTGSGPPLVMVPGWLTHVHELWSHPAAASALAAFAGNHRFVWYDRLGSGLSDRDRTSVSVEDDASQLIAVLDDLNIDRVDLIGYSLGGPTAIEFSVRNPERVNHLVLYASFARGADLAEAELMDAFVAMVRSGWHVASSSLAAVFLPEGTGEDLRWFARFQRIAASPQLAADLLEYQRDLDVRELLTDIRVPTTVVSPAVGQLITMDRARELAAGIPGARLVTVEGKTHDPFIRDVGDVVEAILASVEGRSQARREAPERPSQDVEPLTSRESQVLGAVAEGASNKQVATELGVSVATVERHLTNIYRKLGASGRADAAVRGLRAGILGSDVSDASDG